MTPRPPDVAEHASVAIPVRPQWRGAGVTGDRRSREDLRNAMINAQRNVGDILMSVGPTEMRMWWEVSTSEVTTAGNREPWNPQVGVPPDARWLVCVGWCR